MISSSFYIPEEANIYDLSCEIVPTNGEVVKGVQYQNLNGRESIVDTASRREIFRLSDNPLVTRYEEIDCEELYFRIQINQPGNEMATVYKIDKNNGNVHKVSHLFLKHTGDGLKKDIFILNGSRESYINILNYLKEFRIGAVKNLVVKLNDHWVPFLSINPEEILPE